MLATETPSHSSAVAVAESDPFLDVFEAAAIPKLHPQTIRQAYRGGRLKGIKVNGSRVLRFRKSWVLAWLEGEGRTA